MQRSSQFAYLLQCQPGIFGYFLKRLIILKHTEHKILSGLCYSFFISHLSVFQYSLHVSQLPSWVIPENIYFVIQLPGIIIRYFPGRDIIYQISQFLAYPVPVSLCIDKHTSYAIIQHQAVVFVANGIECVFCQTFSKRVKSANENDIYRPDFANLAKDISKYKAINTTLTTENLSYCFSVLEQIMLHFSLDFT